MLSLSSGFNYFLCGEPVTLRYRHAGLRNYIKGQLHRDPTNGDIYIFLSKDSIVFVSIIFTTKARSLRKRYFMATILLSRYSTRLEAVTISHGRVLYI